MVEKTQAAIPAAMSDLISHGHRFSFSQVMRMARMHLTTAGAQELSEVPWQDRVQIRPELSLAFPAADVARVQWSEVNGGDLLITTTFLGLYGTSSPLPNHYTEDLLDEAAADASVSRDLLDLLHQRLYQLYFQCWSKYRLFIRIAEEQNQQELERLFCLIGLGEDELRDSVEEAESLLRYTALFNQFPRSALCLQTLLRDALGIQRLEVEQFVLRKVRIPEDQQTRLGIANNCLGVNTILGSEMPDRMGKFRIHIGPLSRKEFDTFLPGTPSYQKLQRLIKVYILDPFDFDLKLTMAAGEADPIHLGDPSGPRLGLNSWSFSGDALGEVSAVFPLGPTATPEAVPEDGLCSLDDRREPLTLTNYYQQELALLRDLAAGFAKAHPEVAPIVCGPAADQSIERLFEGVAFLNANLQQKLDDDLPEIIHEVIDATQPQCLRCIPATTIVVFSPKPNCIGSQLVPVGTELKSVPVGGTSCCFTTRYPVELHPLALTDAVFNEPAGVPATISLTFKLTRLTLSEWNLKSLRLYLAGESTDAANLYLVLMQYLKRIFIAPLHGGQAVTLEPSYLKTVGFYDTELLYRSQANDTTSHQMMQEYFILPEKFLFVDLEGWEKWHERGDGAQFQIRFELEKLPISVEKVNKETFALFATPAVNLFKHRAEPIVCQEFGSWYPIVPAESQHQNCKIHSIEKVTGLTDVTAGRIELVHSQKSLLSHSVPVYQLTRSISNAGEGLDTFISVTMPPGRDLKRLRLEVELVCSNGILPELLRPGDICKSSDSSPACAKFRNPKPVRRAKPASLATNSLWRMYSSGNLNIGLLNARSLRAILKALLHAHQGEYATEKVNTRTIEAVVGLQIKPTDRLFEGTMWRGWDIRVRLDGVSFDSPGDLYLFGALLNHFLNGLATEACFTRTTIEDSQRTREYQWPVTRGRRQIL